MNNSDPPPQPPPPENEPPEYERPDGPSKLPPDVQNLRRKQSDRQLKLLIMGVLEAALVLVAIGLGYLFEFSPVSLIHWNWSGVLLGLVATLPMLLFLWLCLSVSWRPLRRIRRMVEIAIVPLLEGQDLLTIALLSFLAGLGEELLFRGLIQGGLTESIGGISGLWTGLIIGAVLFGFAHPVTLGYLISAMLMGLWFGLLLIWTDNLLVSVVTHAAYDFIAMVYYIRLKKT